MHLGPYLIACSLLLLLHPLHECLHLWPGCLHCLTAMHGQQMLAPKLSCVLTWCDLDNIKDSSGMLTDILAVFFI